MSSLGLFGLTPNRYWLRGFVAAYFLSTLGSSLTTIALAYKFLLNSNGLGLQYGWLIGASAVGSLIFAPLVGNMVDRAKDWRPWFIGIDIVLAALTASFGLYSSPLAASVIVLASVPLELFYGSLIFKASAIQLHTEKELISFNRNVDNVTSLGFIFGPLAAPILVNLLHGQKFLFYIDACTYLLSALLNIILFSFVDKQLLVFEGGKRKERRHKASLIKEFRVATEGGRGRIAVGAISIYWIAFSGMAFTLSLVAKNVVGQNLSLYSVPVLAIYLGRITVSRLPWIVSRRGIALFAFGTCGAALGLSMLGLVNNVWLLGFVEFFIGGFVGLARIGEATFLQLLFPEELLGRIGSLRQALPLGAKLISVPLIIAMVGTLGIGGGLIVLAAGYGVASVMSWNARVPKTSPTKSSSALQVDQI